MIDAARVRVLADHRAGTTGAYVLYWMQQSQRVPWNHAFEYAAERANQYAVPLVVVFVVTDSFPEANHRHYRFMLEGIVETAEEVRARGAAFALCIGDPVEQVAAFASDAVEVILDRGYLRVQREWHSSFVERAPTRLTQVESDVVVPVETVSNKQEYSAATIRRKIHRLLPDYLTTHQTVDLEHDPAPLGVDTGPIDLESVEARLEIDRSVKPVASIRGGYGQARSRLDRFVADLLPGYAERRNDPGLEFQSGLSPYLHFGQISPLEIAMTILDDEHAQDREAVIDGEYRGAALSDSAADFLEELIVRRELSMNFVFYNRLYDSIAAIPDWAKATIEEHAKDERPVLYDLDQLETASTHDEYWNAAQNEMLHLGTMHGYMRMYWGKKIIEWSPSAEEAYRRMVYLDNRYFLDGRDANGYTGIGWCFGIHDRAWQEREIFGKLRYMNARGLERKFAIGDYVLRISSIVSP